MAAGIDCSLKFSDGILQVPLYDGFLSVTRCLLPGLKADVWARNSTDANVVQLATEKPYASIKGACQKKYPKFVTTTEIDNGGASLAN